MKRETTKAPYCKPAIRVVEWDFNENICNSVITNSFVVGSCIKAKSKGSRSEIDKRKTEDPINWHWTGSSN